MQTPEELISFFRMQPHPEGGYYLQTYKSPGIIPRESLPAGFSGSRYFSTAIYFLLEKGNFSAFHRIKSDECWHFYTGQQLIIYIIDPEGNLKVVKLGAEIKDGELFQYVVPAGCWFASEPAPDSAFSFVGCTVSPGFDFNDFELAAGVALSRQYPRHKQLIDRLCRK